MAIRTALRAAAAGLLLAGCGGGHAVAAYRPQVREVTITAVPLLVREQAHLFPFLATVLPGLSLALPGQQTTRATYVARTPGIFSFTCNIPTHLPMMWGQLVVLAPQAVGAR